MLRNSAPELLASPVPGVIPGTTHVRGQVSDLSAKSRGGAAARSGEARREGHARRERSKSLPGKHVRLAPRNHSSIQGTRTDAPRCSCTPLSSAGRARVA
jgi:hypothetical protein